MLAAVKSSLISLHLVWIMLSRCLFSLCYDGRVVDKVALRHSCSEIAVEYYKKNPMVETTGNVVQLKNVCIIKFSYCSLHHFY